MVIYLWLLLVIILIALIFIMRNLHWIVSEVRSICRDESGYVKLIQLMFVVLVLGSFFLLLIYTFLSPEPASKSDIFLTVIVGLMGTIVGMFFSERTMESIAKDRDKKRKVIIEKKIKLKERENQIIDLLKKLN